ncbi:MAG: hypothetical protein IJY09_04170 [Lachnospiraceae bacterium]|nr:hypothetical protein [Lachnospiraceae bacterium]
MINNTKKSFGQEQDILHIRSYKDTLFRLIFRERENLLSLYNAMNKTNYTNPEDLEIVTLENAIYMGMKNDVAFLLYDELYLYEHQSTPNPNMPLRDLFYIAREYEKLIDKKAIYPSVPVQVPTPHFVMFYNGSIKEPESRILRLSDLYTKQEEKPELELIVQMLNINFGMNREILERCKLLQDYAKYVDRIRKHAILLPIEEAVEQATKECIDEGILTELLTKYRREVIQVSIFEFDAEKEWKLMREAEREAARKETWKEAYTEGIEAGKAAGIAEGIAEGEAMGCRKGENRFAELSARLLKENRVQDLQRATQDEEYRQQLYAELNL